MKRKSDDVKELPKKILMSIRERFRYFKQRKNPPDFENLKNDLEKRTQVNKDSPLLNSDAKIFELKTGLILAKSLLRPEYAETLAIAALEKFPLKLDSKSNLAKIGESVTDALKSFTKTCQLSKSKLMGLRWITLGYHHNWDTRIYDKTAQSVGEMPKELKKLGAEISKFFDFEEKFDPQASICNYYPANVGTIGIHSDNSGLFILRKSLENFAQFLKIVVKFWLKAKKSILTRGRVCH